MKLFCYNSVALFLSTFLSFFRFSTSLYRYLPFDLLSSPFILFTSLPDFFISPSLFIPFLSSMSPSLSSSLHLFSLLLSCFLPSSLLLSCPLQVKVHITVPHVSEAPFSVGSVWRGETSLPLGLDRRGSNHNHNRSDLALSLPAVSSQVRFAHR